MTPPLPAASRPSKTIATRAPSRRTQSSHLHELDLELVELGLVDVGGELLRLGHRLRPPQTSNSAPSGPRLAIIESPICERSPHASWMWPQTTSGGSFASTAVEDRLAPEVVAGRGAVAMSPGRRVDDQHRAVRAAGQAVGCLVLGQVEAPVPGSRGNAGAEAVEVGALDRRAGSVQHRRRVPAGGRDGFAQLVLGLVVAGDEEGRRRRSAPAPRSSRRPPREPIRSRPRR